MVVNRSVMLDDIEWSPTRCNSNDTKASPLALCLPNPGPDVLHVEVKVWQTTGKYQEDKSVCDQERYLDGPCLCKRVISDLERVCMKFDYLA